MNAGWSLTESAALARREGRLAGARDDYEKALAVSKAANDRRCIIVALKGVGQIERDEGHTENALARYQEAAALARQESDPLLLAHTVRHVADILRHLGRYKQAQAAYDEVLAVYEAHPDAPRLDVANSIRGLAVLKEEMGTPAEALALWKRAHEIYASLGIEAGIAEAKARMR